MAIVFTDWEHLTYPDGTVSVLNWGSEAAIRHSPTIQVFEAIRQAIMERGGWVTVPFVQNSPLFRPGDLGYQLLQLIPTYYSSIACPPPYVKWTVSSMAAAEGMTEDAFLFYLIYYGGHRDQLEPAHPLAEWAHLMYRVINRLRYRISGGTVSTVDITGSTYSMTGNIRPCPCWEPHPGCPPMAQISNLSCVSGSVSNSIRKGSRRSHIGCANWGSGTEWAGGYNWWASKGKLRVTAASVCTADISIRQTCGGVVTTTYVCDQPLTAPDYSWTSAEMGWDLSMYTLPPCTDEAFAELARQIVDEADQPDVPCLIDGAVTFKFDRNSEYIFKAPP